MADEFFWGTLKFSGTAGNTITTGQIEADTIDGAGTGVYAVGGGEGKTTGQWRAKKALPFQAPADSEAWARIRRSSGIVGDNSAGAPSALTNILEFNAAADAVQIAVGVNATGNAVLVAGTGTGGSNVTSTWAGANDGEPYDYVLHMSQVASEAEVKIHVGDGHATLVPKTLIETVPMTGVGIGLTQLVEPRFGSMNAAASAHVQRLDKFLAQSAEIAIPEPGEGEDGELDQVTAMATETGFVLAVRVTTGDAYRLVVSRNGAEVEGSPTEWVTPTAGGAADGFALLPFDAGTPATDYGWQVQTRIASVATDVGQPHTLRSLPRAGVPFNGALKVFLRGCQQENDHDYWAHDDVDEWGPHYGIHGGDFDYANDDTATLASQLGHLLDQQQLVVRQRQHMRDIPSISGPLGSDHDREGRDDTFATACIPFAQDAARVLFPYADTPVAGSMACRVPFGRFQFVMCDVRTLDRTDPFPGVAWDWDGDDAFAVSADEEAQLIEWITDTDYEVTFFCTDMPWGPGPTPGTQTDDKGDHWQNYPAQAARIGAAMTGRQGMVLQWDLHGVGADSGVNNPWGGWPVVTNAGIRSGSGPSNSQHNGGADRWDHGYFPDEDTPESIKIATYGRLTLSDNGSTMVAQWEGRSMSPGVDTNTPASYTAIWGAAAGDLSSLGLVLDSVELSADSGSWIVIEPTQVDDVSAPDVMPGSMLTRPTPAERGSDLIFGASVVQVVMLVTDLDEFGLHGGAVTLESNKDALKALVTGGLQLLGFTINGFVVKERLVQLASNIAFTDPSETDVVCTFLLAAKAGSWQTQDYETWPQQIGQDKEGLQVDILDGITAPVFDADVRVSGPLNSITFTDANSGAWFTWEIPGGTTEDPSIVAGEFVIFDFQRFQAAVVDFDSWNIDAGVMHTEGMDWGAPLNLAGRSAFVLTGKMQGNNPRDRRVFLDILNGGADHDTSLVEIRARKSYR